VEEVLYSTNLSAERETVSLKRRNDVETTFSVNLPVAFVFLPIVFCWSLLLSLLSVLRLPYVH